MQCGADLVRAVGPIAARAAEGWRIRAPDNPLLRVFSPGSIVEDRERVGKTRLMSNARPKRNIVVFQVFTHESPRRAPQSLSV
jgi:hypothetical protein